jgi:hypothetical protein
MPQDTPDIDSTPLWRPGRKTPRKVTIVLNEYSSEVTSARRTSPSLIRNTRGIILRRCLRPAFVVAVLAITTLVFSSTAYADGNYPSHQPSNPWCVGPIQYQRTVHQYGGIMGSNGQQTIWWQPPYNALDPDTWGAQLIKTGDQWTQYRTVVGYRNSSGSISYIYGPWVGTWNGRFDQWFWRQSTNGTWIDSAQQDARDQLGADASVVVLSRPYSYSVWIEYYWGPVKVYWEGAWYAYLAARSHMHYNGTVSCS